MEKYSGLTKVAWFICGLIWGNCFSRLFGLDIAGVIGGIAFIVVVIVMITVVVVETRSV